PTLYSFPTRRSSDLCYIHVQGTVKRYGLRYTEAMPKQSRTNLASPFITVGVTAIVGAGVLSAFMAHAPSRHAMWAVAYLILVVRSEEHTSELQSREN